MRRKMIADMKSWKDQASAKAACARSTTRANSRCRRAARRPRRHLQRLSAKLGYKFVTRETERRDADRRQARRADEARLHLGAPGDRHHLPGRPARQQPADQAANVALQQDADQHQHGDQRHSAGTSAVVVEPDVSRLCVGAGRPVRRHGDPEPAGRLADPGPAVLDPARTSSSSITTRPACRNCSRATSS